MKDIYVVECFFPKKRTTYEFTDYNQAESKYYNMLKNKRVTKCILFELTNPNNPIRKFVEYEFTD